MFKYRFNLMDAITSRIPLALNLELQALFVIRIVHLILNVAINVVENAVNVYNKILIKNAKKFATVTYYVAIDVRQFVTNKLIGTAQIALKSV